MLSDIIALVVCLNFVAALIFLLLGRWIVYDRKIIQNLLTTKEELGHIVLEHDIPQGTALLLLSRLLLFEVALLHPTNEIHRKYKSRPLGDVINIVHYNELNLTRIIYELRSYAFMLAILWVV